MNLREVRRFVVPENIVASTDEALRAAGADGYECFVLWTGVQKDDQFTVHSTHVPKQTAYKMKDGLCVRVEGEALHRLNVWQFESGETLGVQIHSHPTEAFHSETDDAYPIVTALGGVSLVVPDFADAGMRGPGLAAYRLTDDGWDELDDSETRELIVMAQ